MSGNGLVSYYLSKVLDSIGITSQDEKLVVNGGLMIYNFFISLAFAFMVNWFRRRTMFISSFFSMLICYIIWTVLSAINQKRNFNDKPLAQGVLAMIFMYYIAYNFGFNGLPWVFITEILPFTLRTKGVNILQVTQQFCSVYNGYVNPIAMDAIKWKYYIIWCCINAVECVVCYCTFVETSGKTLEEVAEVFGEKPIDVKSLSEKKLSTEHDEHGSESVADSAV
ncbi:unnamed protein product [Ambrosiozyma monospora]|uniref:Unnamed protein product n=1 Tax=Ambrosiozyma monospora TaxID=43982 RepID=A0ACB5UD34_AMBMO|nr:unnamed protein product [Ambrosiozyma monospora]